MKTIYICSRYAGDTEKNVANAIKYSKWIYKQGDFPMCVHAFLNEVTGLSEIDNREKLLELGRYVLSLCDELYCFTAYGFSEGMKMEIDYAHKNNIPVRYIPFIPNLDDSIRALDKNNY